MDINWTLLAPLILLQLILQVLALINLYKQNMERNKKIIWVIIILIFNILGPIIYFVFGRRDN